MNDTNNTRRSLFNIVAYVKRDIHLPKETYICQKRRTFSKRDLHTSNMRLNAARTRLLLSLHIAVYVKRNIHLPKETCARATHDSLCACFLCRSLLTYVRLQHPTIRRVACLLVLVSVDLCCMFALCWHMLFSVDIYGHHATIRLRAHCYSPCHIYKCTRKNKIIHKWKHLHALALVHAFPLSLSLSHLLLLSLSLSLTHTHTQHTHTHLLMNPHTHLPTLTYTLHSQSCTGPFIWYL